MLNIDRHMGCLLGLAVGDALGATNEFMPAHHAPEVREMIGGGVFNLPAGAWTDDTAMALAMADSLLVGRFNLRDQMENYARWKARGDFIWSRFCFDCGGQTSGAIARYGDLGVVPQHPSQSEKCGNGSVMRLAPAPMRYAGHSRRIAAKFSADSSLPTHDSVLCWAACAWLGRILHAALNGEGRTGMIAASQESLAEFTQHMPLHQHAQLVTLLESDVVAAMPRKSLNPTGYVLDTLLVAWWSFLTTDTFEEAVVAATSMGGDADTIGAVVGQIAGAHYGAAGIPPRWLEKLVWRQHIADVATKLYSAAARAIPVPTLDA